MSSSRTGRVGPVGARLLTLGATAAVALVALVLACSREPVSPRARALAAVPQLGTVPIAQGHVIEGLDREGAPAALQAWRIAGVKDSINVTFHGRTNRTWVLDAATHELIEMQPSSDANATGVAARRFDLRALGLKTPEGLAVDPGNGSMFVLDGRQIVKLAPDPVLGLEHPLVSAIDLATAGLSHARGIAFDPKRGTLQVLDPGAHVLHEISQAGEPIATRDVSEFELSDPQGMLVAPTLDATDDASETSVYVASGGNITELSLAAAVTPAAATYVPTLVRTTQTSQYSPPSPDPAGVTYAEHLGKLLIFDSEVEEMTIWAGYNVFEATTAGSQTGKWSTMSFSDEPTGAAYNPANHHIFISDDDARRVNEINPGADDRYGTSDDRVTWFDTKAFGSDDPEGIAYDPTQRALFILDGVNAEVYRITPGANGVFDGAPSAGDDQSTHWDTQASGLTDPEGIVYAPDVGHLYIVGKPATLVFEFTTTGSLVRTIDISAAKARKPAGLGYGPSSNNPAGRSLYIVDRGLDNDSYPTENDGKMYEFAMEATSGNTPPVVTITAPVTGTTLEQGAAVTFTATATDAEDGNLAARVSWSSSLDGSLGSGGSLTTSSLSAGTHTITASVADNGGAQSSSTITVTVAPPGAGTTVQVRVAASTDDAEESSSGSVSLTSSDLELVYDGNSQTVGMRFAGLAVPPGATITNAYVQFQVDETGSTATTVTLRGEASDNPVTFSNTNKVSTRPRTTSTVSWTPVAWTSVGQAGAEQRTPNLATVVQEIVNRSGWRSGNALAIIVTGSGTGKRTAVAYDGAPTGAPLLHVEYTTGSPPPNSAPTVANVSISGTAQVGQTLTGSYVYSDAENDAEGASTYRWLRDGKAIGGATARTYALTSSDEGTLIRFEVTPVATSGTTPGTAVQSAAVGPVAALPPTNTAPVAANVTIVGTAQVGQTLKGTYLYSDADGDAESTSTYRWLRNGAPIVGVASSTYTLVAADEGAMIRFEVTPVAATGATPGTAVQSAAVGPVAALPPNTAPVVTNVSIVGTPQVGVTLRGSYTYTDAEGDAEGASRYRWLRNGAAIAGATSGTYALSTTDQGTLISFEVTPVAATGTSPGTAVVSAAIGPVAAAPTPSGTVNVRVSVGTDDAEESAAGSMYITSGDLEMTFDGSNQTVGIRFPGLSIPPGASITRAWVQFTADDTSSQATSLTIQGEASDNEVTFSTASRISTRPRTTSAVSWVPVPWTVKRQAGLNQQTPDLAAVIQEIVSRSGWQSGNAVVVIITGTGLRAAESYEGYAAGAPLLHVEYTTP